jgi:hypothetical protein
MAKQQKIRELGQTIVKSKGRVYSMVSSKSGRSDAIAIPTMLGDSSIGM